MYEELASSDEGLFMDCSVNSLAYTMFNKHTKSTMESIKIIVNDVLTEVNPCENEYLDIISHNVEQDVADNIGNNVQSAEEDGNLDDDKYNATKIK